MTAKSPTGSSLTGWEQLQLLCLLLTDSEPTSYIERINSTDSWPTLVDLASSHQCLPALAAKLNACAHLSCAPETTPASLNGLGRQVAVRTMSIYAQALRLAETLNKAEITPIFLKGTATLLSSKAADFAARDQADIDVVVEPANLRAACEQLVEAGYRFTTTRPNDNKGNVTTHRDIERALKESRYHHHLPPMTHPKATALVELHRYHLPAGFDQAGILEDLLNTAATHTAGDIRFRVPSFEHRAIHLILGSFVHDGYAATCRVPIRPALDYIQLMSEATADDTKIDNASVAQTCGIRGEQFFYLLKWLFEVEAPILFTEAKANALTERLIKARYNNARTATYLDTLGRVRHLGKKMLVSPGKLTGYIRNNLKG
ncbi:hypothetical protein A3709_10530 [Halioglobus sp. HI00S01]|uniref:nucleotidyltransferase family protein n=1 Tax=Halioglobus sp. HI00S01 TaxID=1822214 RepID=UPI0007C20426|nr:nucleotidyltransferase family protein [Halioglobus sp. HI00S01]KZX51256.1 hypothetical protein A3709_10530 [Halioglobus sp. HI00S01]